MPNTRFSACQSDLNDCIDQNCSFKINQASETDVREHLNRHLFFKNHLFKCKICYYGLDDLEDVKNHTLFSHFNIYKNLRDVML